MSFYKSGGLLIETIQMIILVCSWLRRAGNASQGVSIYFFIIIIIIIIIIQVGGQDECCLLWAAFQH